MPLVRVWIPVNRAGWARTRLAPLAATVAAAAGSTSINLPKLVLLLATTAIVEVPVLVMLPLAKGLATVGRTRMFCQVSEQVTPLLLAAEAVKVICVVVRDVTDTEVPLATPLMFLLLLPMPASRSILTVGAVPLVSKTNPL